MIIEVVRIPPEGKKFTGEEPASILNTEDAVFVKAGVPSKGSGVVPPSRAACDLRVAGPIRYDLTAQVVSNELIVTGALTVDMLFRCSRCAEFFPLSAGEPSFECVHEIVDRAESVDLTADIREAIVLTFPAYPVCRAECKGLCPQCGTNLNREKCNCTSPGDFRLGGLKDLNIK